MKNIILFDHKDTWTDLLPLSYTRPLADIRIGILTIREKWKRYFPDDTVSCLTVGYLSAKYPTVEADDNIFIAGNICPDTALARRIGALEEGQSLHAGPELIAFRGSRKQFDAAEFADDATYADEYCAIRFTTFS